MPLAAGDIVTVLLEDSLHSDQQGEVVEIVNDGDSDGPIGVKFGRWCKYLFQSFHDGSESTVCFEEAELRIVPRLLIALFFLPVIHYILQQEAVMKWFLKVFLPAFLTVVIACGVCFVVAAIGDKLDSLTWKVCEALGVVAFFIFLIDGSMTLRRTSGRVGFRPSKFFFSR